MSQKLSATAEQGEHGEVDGKSAHGSLAPAVEAAETEEEYVKEGGKWVLKGAANAVPPLPPNGIAASGTGGVHTGGNAGGATGSLFAAGAPVQPSLEETMMALEKEVMRELASPARKVAGRPERTAELLVCLSSLLAHDTVHARDHPRAG